MYAYIISFSFGFICMYVCTIFVCLISFNLSRHFRQESFLEDINNLLNSGEVPNLFEEEDIEQILTTVRPLCKLAGKFDSRENILLHFVQV